MYSNKQKLGNYAHDLAKLMQQVVLVSSVAVLANEFNKSKYGQSSQTTTRKIDWDTDELQKMMTPIEANKERASVEQQAAQHSTEPTYVHQSSPRLADLLERWEEPNRIGQQVRPVSL